jgi:hypothetical protein
MLKINLKNIEELVFESGLLKKLLPEFIPEYDQWRLSKMSPSLRQLGKRTLIKFINGLNDEHILILECHFGTKITIDKLDYHIVKNYEFPTSKLENELNEIQGLENFTTYTDGVHTYLSFWR